MNFDKKAFMRLMKQPAISPVDCPNFITYKAYSQYQWYARTLVPLIVLTRGGPLFVGNRVTTLRGEVPCDTWMVVRYPSHRAMLKMTINPYYLAVCNPFRVRGTQRLELGLTQARDVNSGLHRHPQVLALHVAGEDADDFFSQLRRLATQTGLDVVYESELRLNFDFVRNPSGADPMPLTYPITAALAGDEAALREFANSAEVDTLLAAMSASSVNLYRRAGKNDYLKFGKSSHRPSDVAPQ